jgi:hypothetical protein
MNLDLAQLRDFALRYAAWYRQDPVSVGAFFAPNGSLEINDAAASLAERAPTEASGVHDRIPRSQDLTSDQLLVVGPPAVTKSGNFPPKTSSKIGSVTSTPSTTSAKSRTTFRANSHSPRANLLNL